MATQGDYGTILEEQWGKGEGRRERGIILIFMGFYFYNVVS